MRLMLKKIFIFLITFINKVSQLLFNKNIFFFLYNQINEKSYKTININNKNISFFVPNELLNWRVDTFYSKEPETLEWIDSFQNQKKEYGEHEKIIFWDIGANIGLYSIYAALKYQNICIFAFEHSFLNLRVLSRNISINNLNSKISICQLPLSNKKFNFSSLQDSTIIEGGALNAYDTNLGHDGNELNYKNSYNIIGTSIDQLIELKILPKPDFIKIDVDGIEHKILSGGIELLNSKYPKSISVEINEDFEEQYNKCIEIMKNSNYKFYNKRHSKLITVSKNHNKTFNYLFKK